MRAMAKHTQLTRLSRDGCNAVPTLMGSALIWQRVQLIVLAGAAAVMISKDHWF